MKRREAALASRGAAGIDPMMIKNFPSCCPMVHHDIINDIPEFNKAIMRAYGSLLCLKLPLILTCCPRSTCACYFPGVEQIVPTQ